MTKYWPNAPHVKYGRQATLMRPSEDARHVETSPRSFGNAVADLWRRHQWQRKAVVFGVMVLCGFLWLLSRVFLH